MSESSLPAVLALAIYNGMTVFQALDKLDAFLNEGLRNKNGFTVRIQEDPLHGMTNRRPDTRWIVTGPEGQRGFHSLQWAFDEALARIYKG